MGFNQKRGPEILFSKGESLNYQVSTRRDGTEITWVTMREGAFGAFVLGPYSVDTWKPEMRLGVRYWKIRS